MTEHVTPSARPHANPKGLYERVLLQAELRRCRAWLRNFGALRDSVRLSGQDADARYHQIASRCQQLTEELAARTPASAVPAVVRARAADLLSLPVAPATFDPLTGSVSFGFSGHVQLGRPQEGTLIIPEGTTGSIRSLLFSDDGTVVFGGDIVSAPAVGQPKEYFSLHSWTCLIPFPAPVLNSTFTYSLKIGVEVAGITMFTSASMLPTTFWSFISVGETSNFTGQDIAVNTPAGWPLIVDWPDAPYSTDYTGQSTLQRSFVVNGGHTPAVALVVGAVVALESGAEMHFDNGGVCLFQMGANVPPNGYFQEGVANFHYDPIIQVHG